MAKESNKETTKSEEIVKEEESSALQEASPPSELLEDLATRHDDPRLLELSGQLTAGIKGVESVTRPTVTNLMIRQKMSSNDLMPEACKVGELYDTDGDCVGSEIEFIPILQHPMRKRWIQTEDGSQIDCMSLDGKQGSKYGACADCPYGSFEDGNRPSCSPGYTFYGITNEMNKLYRIDFIKTNAKAGKTMLRLARPPALWARSFTLTVHKEKSKSGFDYYMFSVRPSGNKIEGYLYDACDALHSFYRDMYAQALEMQRQYAEKQGTEGQGITDESIPEVQEGDSINFDDSM